MNQLGPVLIYIYTKSSMVFPCAIKLRQAPAERYDFDVETKKSGCQPVCNWVYKVVAILIFVIIFVTGLTLPERTVVASS